MKMHFRLAGGIGGDFHPQIFSAPGRFPVIKPAFDAEAQKRAQRGAPPMTAAAARRVFRRHGVPRRLVRAHHELTRVRQHPGQVRGYVHGRVRGAPDCPCAYPYP